MERLEDRIEQMMGRVEGSITGLGEKVEKDMTQMRVQSGVAGLRETVQIVPPATEDNITTIESLAVTPSISPLSQSLERMSPLLDKVAVPSRDRDIAFSAGCGAVLGVMATAFSLWLGR